MKIVINACFGDFGLSPKALDRYKELAGIVDEDFDCDDIKRDCPYLIQTVEEFGSGAAGIIAELKVVEIPNEMEWEIVRYNGKEYIAEKHRKWS